MDKQILFVELHDHITQSAKNAGLNFDVYDPDFLVGTIMVWLDKKDLALTGGGLKRVIFER
jgi:hypothetical protein